MSDINEEEALNTEDEPTTKEDELSTTEDEIINSNNETTTINSNNEQPTKDEQPTKPKRKIIPPTRPKREPLPKVRLTTAERNKIIYDYERGVSNPNWEVIITKTNKKIVRRKKDPAATYSPISGLTKSEPKSSSPPGATLSPLSGLIQTQTPQTSSLPQTSTPPSNKDWMASIQYYNVQNSFNEQLMKQIDELNNKITHQNNKHKKLKTKYKKLKRSIFSDDSDNETQPININQPDERDFVPEARRAEPAENANLDTSINDNVNYNNNEQVEYESQPQRRRKLNLRDTIDFTKYGFSPL